MRATHAIGHRLKLDPKVTANQRGHGVGLFADSKPHILEDVTTRIDAGMTLIVHPNTYHPVVGYLVLGDVVVATQDGGEVLTATARELFSVAG